METGTQTEFAQAVAEVLHSTAASPNAGELADLLRQIAEDRDSLAGKLLPTIDDDWRSEVHAQYARRSRQLLQRLYDVETRVGTIRLSAALLFDTRQHDYVRRAAMIVLVNPPWDDEWTRQIILARADPEHVAMPKFYRPAISDLPLFCRVVMFLARLPDPLDPPRGQMEPAIGCSMAWEIVERLLGSDEKRAGELLRRLKAEKAPVRQLRALLDEARLAPRNQPHLDVIQSCLDWLATEAKAEPSPAPLTQ